MSSSRLFIVNAQPGGNKGAEAMLETVIREIRASSLSSHCEIWIEALNVSPMYHHFCQRIGLPANIFLFQPRNVRAPYDICPNRSDVMIDIGGVNYADNSAIANFRNLRRHNFFRRAGAKRIFFTQDFGPAQKFLTKAMARRALGLATCVMSRSQESYDRLEKVVPGIRISGPYPDCTLLLPALVPKTRLPMPYVALVPSAIMFNNHRERYMQLMTEIARALPKKITPVVLAHNFTANDGTFDTTICKNLHERIAEFRDGLLFQEAWPPSALKGLLADADAVITSRFHAMVGAMSCGVPAYAIGWNHKYQQFISPYGMNDMTLDMTSLGHDVAEIRAVAVGIVRRALSVTEEQYSHIEKVNNEQKRKVRASFTELVELIANLPE